MRHQVKGDQLMPTENLLLIPGLACTKELYHNQITALEGACNITIADHTQAGTVSAIAGQILQKAPDRFALAGLSMGGYLSFEILRQAPERVERLLLLDTKASLDPPETAARRRQLMNEAEAEGLDGIVTKLLPLLVHPDRLHDRTVVEIVTRMTLDTGVDAFINQQNAILNRPDSTGDLAGINCPVLIIVGDSDILTPPEEARAMQGAIPDAQLKVIADCGHLSTIEQPEAVTALFRSWLEV